MAAPRNGVWYVKFPTYQYNEDVAALAKVAGLRILDARFDVGDGAKDAPKLTLKDDGKAAASKAAQPRKVKPVKAIEPVKPPEPAKVAVSTVEQDVKTVKPNDSKDAG